MNVTIVGLIGLLVLIQLIPGKPKEVREPKPKGFFDIETIHEKRIRW